MAAKEINTPVQSRIFGPGSPGVNSGSVTLKHYPAEDGINAQARGSGAHTQLNSPAPSKLLGGMKDDDRSNGK